MHVAATPTMISGRNSNNSSSSSSEDDLLKEPSGPRPPASGGFVFRVAPVAVAANTTGNAQQGASSSSSSSSPSSSSRKTPDPLGFGFLPAMIGGGSGGGGAENDEEEGDATQPTPRHVDGDDAPAGKGSGKGNSAPPRHMWYDIVESLVGGGKKKKPFVATLFVDLEDHNVLHAYWSSGFDSSKWIRMKALLQVGRYGRVFYRLYTVVSSNCACVRARDTMDERAFVCHGWLVGLSVRRSVGWLAGWLCDVERPPRCGLWTTNAGSTQTHIRTRTHHTHTHTHLSLIHI